MADCGALCAVLSALLHKHGWGSPIEREELVARSSVEHEGDAKDAIEVLRGTEYPFVIVSNSRVTIDNGYLEELYDFLILKCDRDPQELKWRDSHYEGWHTHSWWPPE